MDAHSAILASDAFRAGPIAQVVLDVHGEVVIASDHAVRLLGASACEAGRLFDDPDLRVAAIRSAATGEVVETGVSPRTVRITPLGRGEGAALTWLDVAEGGRLRDARRQLRETVAELASLSEQLHVSNAHLRAVSDDLGNANRELESLNDEVRDRSLELAELDERLLQIVRASGAPALVVDAGGRVRMWTREAALLWSLPAGRTQAPMLAELGVAGLVDAVADAAADATTPPGEVVVTSPDGARLVCTLHPVHQVGDVVIFVRRSEGDSRPRVSGQGRPMAPPGSHAFELRVPAVPASVGELRHALSSELQALPVPTSLVEDIGLAVSEAATNAVLHAYRDDSPGPLCLYARLMDDTVHVVVRDHGRGMTPRPDSPGLGLGLPLMTRLADAVQISTHPDGGTEVRMTFTVAREDPSPRFAHP